MPEDIQIKINGKPVSVTPLTVVATAIAAEGIRRFRRSVKGKPRTPLCGMGVCFECRVTIKALEAREEALNPGKPIDGKKQISFADKEARIMGKKGDFDYRYNGQISVDSDHQVIVGQHLSQNANDKQEVKEGLESIEKSTGQLPEKNESGQRLSVGQQS